MRCTSEEDGIVDDCPHPFLPFFSAELRWLNCGKDRAVTMLSLGFRWHLHGQTCVSVLQPWNTGSMRVLLLCCWGLCLLWHGCSRQLCRRGRCGARAPGENMLLLNLSSHLPRERALSLLLLSSSSSFDTSL